MTPRKREPGPIQDATKELRARVEKLEADLKKSRTEITTAQKEKSEIAGKLKKTDAELEQAKAELAKTSKAEGEVRDQLSAAQKSLSNIQASGSADQKAALALKGEITQLQKALQAAEAGRAAAEKENAAAQTKLLESTSQVASVTQERDSMQRERDDALKQLKVAGEAESRVQVLIAENSELKQKLASAEKSVREISARYPISAARATSVSTSTSVPPLENRLKATPVLRTWTRLMPGRNFRWPPAAIPVATVCFVSWSSATTS